MDFSVILKDVKKLSCYVSLTQDMDSKYNDVKIEFNLSTLQCLKNIRSLEIEYFNKYHETGAALMIVEKMLEVPPSKSWSYLGIEVVFLIQYWMDAVRKHLINHHIHWWSFLKRLLNFIKVVIEKNNNFNNLLLEHLTDGLLDLATRGKIEVNQRFEILHTLNLYCVKCSKKLRYIYRDQYEHYFIRLATMLATCGHVPTQYMIMVTLLRWLVLRSEQTVRRDAALKWLPQHLYKPELIQLFVDRTWYNFEQDVRDFINMHNNTSDQITSAVCKKLIIGDKVLVPDCQSHQTWLDLNVALRCVTILLVPSLLYDLGISTIACETLSITGDMAQSAKLFKESSEVTLSILTFEPPILLPSDARAFGDALEVRAVVSSRNCLSVDNALRNIFDDKYELSLNLEDLQMSPDSDEDPQTEPDKRLPAIRRSRHIGLIVKSVRQPPAVQLKSPSSVSSSSLAQLHDKLEALPRINFDKEPVNVCVTPGLSEVAELPEVTSSNTLPAPRHCDVISKRFVFNRASQSDSETLTKNKKVDFLSDGDENRSGTQNFFKSKNVPEFEVPKNKNIDAIIDEDSTSCLLVTTVGSADQSVINDTLERLAKDNECRPDNIVDLLVQEQLKSKAEDKTRDSGINISVEVRKTQDADSEVIENTLEFQAVSVQCKEFREVGTITPKSSDFTAVSKSTSNESNIEAITEAQYTNVTVRRNKKVKNVADDNIDREAVATTAIDPIDVEEFFSQHYAECRQEDGIISPTLAKKINETTSESSDAFDQCLINNADDIANVAYEFPDEVLNECFECINDIVDKVCSDFDKYCEYFAQQDVKKEIPDNDKNKNVINEEKKCIGAVPKMVYKNPVVPPKRTAKDKPKHPVSFKLQIKTTKKRLNKQQNHNNKLKIEKMSPIIEVNNEVSDKSLHNSTKTSVRSNKRLQETEPEKRQKISSESDLDTPLARRRRKLYSPKADVLEESNKSEREEVVKKVRSDDDDIALNLIKKLKSPEKKSETPQKRTESQKLKAYRYSEIEKARENYRILRSRKNVPKFKPSSPKTRKRNDVFDKLKKNIENEEKITVVDVDKDIGVYNFTSDSDDEDFKKKKVDLQNRISTTTLESVKSVVSTRRRLRTRAKSAEVSSDDNTNVTAKRKKLTKRKNSKTKIKNTVKSTCDLVDEKMRKEKNTENLNSSFVIQKNTDKNVSVQDPKIVSPKIEFITNDEQFEKDLNGNQETILNLDEKENKKIVKGKNSLRDNEDDRTISPLPGLVVEQENPGRKTDDINDSLTTNLEKKLKKAYQEGPEALLFNDTNTTHNLLSDLEKTNISAIANEDYIENADENLKMNEALNIKSPSAKVTRMNGNDKMIQSPKSIGKDENICPTYEEFGRDVDKSMSLENESNASSKPTRKLRSLQLKSRKYPRNISGKISPKNDATHINRNVNETTRIKTPKTDFIKLNISRVSDYNKACKKSDSFLKVENKQKSFTSEVLLLSDATDVKSGKSIGVATDMKSEKSIATVGITARGELEYEETEEPKNLDESLYPRELADMDDSLKEYYIKLKSQIESSKDANSKERSKDQNSSENKISSPVVSVRRMPTEEVMRWLSHDKGKAEAPKTNQDIDITIYLPSRRNSDSDISTEDNSKTNQSEKTPVVSLTRLSPIEMNKWLSPRDSIEKLPLRLESRTKTSTPEMNVDRNTLISPIKLFEDIPKFRKTINTYNDSPSNKLRDDSPCQNAVNSPVFNVSNKFFRSSNPTNSRLATSTRSSRVLRKYSAERCQKPVNEGVRAKKRKIDVSLDKEISGVSEASASGVEKWFKTQPSQAKAAPGDNSTRDAVQFVVERLDTTLAEIHQNTTENFIALFVNAQKNLSEIREQKLQTHERLSTKIFKMQKELEELSGEVADMDRRTREMDQEFTDWFKNCAAEIIRSDCRRKRTMISLLREDIDAMFDYAKSQDNE